MQELICPTMLAAWFTHFMGIVGAKEQMLFLSIKVQAGAGLVRDWRAVTATYVSRFNQVDEESGSMFSESAHSKYQSARYSSTRKCEVVTASNTPELIVLQRSLDADLYEGLYRNNELGRQVETDLEKL